MKPAAYVRKSHADAASADHQLASIREMAARQGIVEPLEVYADIGVSGRYGQRGAKSAWRRLRDDIEAGRVDLVYITALDRAGRSLEEWLAFTRLCVERKVEVRDQSGLNRADGDNDIATIEMLMADREGRKAVERSARGKATQKRRGDEVYQGSAAYGRMRIREDGRPDGRLIEVDNPDEPIQPLIDAVDATRGNILRAARILNAAGFTTRSGRPWDPRVLTRAMDRRAVRRQRRTGPAKRRGAPSDAPLARLVACHCGALMTPARDRRNGRWLELVCAPGRKAGVAAHGKTVARSRFIMDALKSELTERSVKRTEVYTYDPAGIAAGRDEVTEAIRKLGRVYRSGGVSEEEFDEESAALKDRLADLEDIDAEAASARLTFSGPVVSWDAPDAEVGEALRRAVRVVRLDAEMQPVSIERRAS